MSDAGAAVRSPIDVDVIIVAHNSGDLLQASVRSAVEQVGEGRVWVMDAESTDGAPDRLCGTFPDTHVVAVPNRGFSASNNRGIELTNGEYVLVLNPDAELQPGALEALVAAACRQRAPGGRVGILGPLVVNSDGTAQANSYGRFPTLTSQLGLRVWRLWQRLRGNPRLSPRVPPEAQRVDWVTGACMLVRRDAIQDAGPMDEQFFLYYEDVEWCHRMADHGWDVVLVPQARCVHHLGQSDTPSGFAANAYRDSFFRYCDLYGLWGLKVFGRMSAAVRRFPG